MICRIKGEGIQLQNPVGLVRKNVPMFSNNVMFYLNVFKCVFNAYHIEFVHSTYVNAFYYFIPFIHDGSGSQFLASHTTF